MPASVETGTPAVSAAPSASPTGPAPLPTLTVAFTDIAGIYAEPAIRSLGKLGVFESTSGAFRPHEPIKRREYLRWLVKTNNAYNKDDNAKFVRLAETGPASFVDVGMDDPDYKYIQGMANAGFVIGIDKNHFAPDRLLTREELLAITVSADLGGAASDYTSPIERSINLNVSDLADINPKYSNPLGQRDAGVVMHRAFGNIKALKPKQQVTRGEAALALASAK
ncbi:MAG: hypothetical protein NVSMB31_08100 [Vulcanimicrobiaceae bacterium]